MAKKPDYQLAVRRAAIKAGIAPEVFLRQIQQESGFNPNAKSGAGAQGIAQFMPATAKQYGVDLNDGKVSDDLAGAARYLSDALKQNGGSYAKALSVYNSGKPNAYKDPNFAGGQTYNYVKTILGGKDVKASTDAKRKALTEMSGGTPAKFDQAGFDDAKRKQTLATYLTARGKNHGGLSALFSSGTLSTAPVDRSQFTTTATPTVKATPGKGASPNTDSGRLAQIIERANTLDKRKLPYVYGGGHQASVANVKTTGPVDCSGAVSAVLGINPRVSGQFQKWGRPGAAPGGRGVTVYSNPEHVIVEINGHFFGTSRSNPGGGAGWIPRAQINSAYLSRFTARHSTTL